MDTWQEFYGPNAGYVAELYERYLRDPLSVDAATRAYFERAGGPPPVDLSIAPTPQAGEIEHVPYAPPDGRQAAPVAEQAASVAGQPGSELEKAVALVQLASAIRSFGHLAAQLDPLGGRPPGDPSLDLDAYRLGEHDLRSLPGHLVGGPVGEQAPDSLTAVRRLREVYCSRTGYDYDHVRLPDARFWLREAAESGRFRPPQDPIDPRALLARLTRVEVFEQFLQRFYPGKTRFSIEGLDMLVPILDEVIAAAAEGNVATVLIGMAHRGRLNVLAHILNKPFAQVLAEFKDPLEGQTFMIREDLGWTGDVKYHKGARRAIQGGQVHNLTVSMIPNPSHLEYVNPVIEGMARSAVTRVEKPGPPQIDERMCTPILIHGDASFPGQGVVAETLNLSNTEGFRTGGTVHIIANNQLGFTAERQEFCSTLYASDLAKGFKIPVMHVNADDPEACIEAARTAWEYTQSFERDFLIDLVGYRRYGHNEGDDPTFTQPVMYRNIDVHPTVRALWAKTLAERGVMNPVDADALVKEGFAELQAVADNMQPERDAREEPPHPPPPGAARHVDTAVPARHLREMNEGLLQPPEGFNLNPKLSRVLDRRRKAFAETDDSRVAIDWSAAEALAFASILADGTSIRLTGEDVERGTFSHRHDVWIDVETNDQHVPHHALPQAQAAFEIHNSPVSELAPLGFEYGYSIFDPKRLTIWEAQYGDFVNGAQVIIDEYLVSARAKWGHTPSLVLLLPHGSEGQGPDHSSSRVERFLQSAAETNIRIAYPSTAKQYFHLLRRQAALLETDPLPLIVLTPKSLLRHPLSASTLADLATGRWQPVIDDQFARQKPEAVRRAALCSGKVWADAAGSKLREGREDVALVRMEQLYVFPAEELCMVLEGYAGLREVVWLQEEPENMGAWETMAPRLTDEMSGRWPLRYIGRPRSSSPAEGSTARYVVNQNRLIEQVFEKVGKG